MPNQAAQSVELDEGDNVWSSLTISVFTGRNGGLQEKITKLHHGPKAFAPFKVALRTLFASFCKTFSTVIVLHLLSVTEVVSKNRAYSHTNLTCVRLNENTSGPDLLARFVKWLSTISSRCVRACWRVIFDGKTTSVALAHLSGSPGEQHLHRSDPMEQRIEG